MPKRKICVVTGTRAEYGLLRHLMKEILDSNELELQVIATGMHLSPEFGLTYREIENDGFPIDRKVEMLLSSDTPVAIAKATGLGTIGFADALDQLNPDILVLLGDRYEILAAATAALFARIPIAHIHGGETTEGAFDESVRHAITKMSHLHFVATELARQRVIQLGEDPKLVSHVGGLGVDAIKRISLLPIEQLEQRLEFSLAPKFFLVTFHPTTLESGSAEQQTIALLDALSIQSDAKVLFTLPNADSEGRTIRRLVEQYVALAPQKTIACTSLGQQGYLSAMKHAYAVVGNSSSGLLEAPSLGTPTIDIGDRQKGREKATSVISCEANQHSIQNAFNRLNSPEFKRSLRSIASPYEHNDTVDKIVSQLSRTKLDRSLLKKRFHNLPLSTTEPDTGKRLQ